MQHHARNLAYAVTAVDGIGAEQQQSQGQQREQWHTRDDATDEHRREEHKHCRLDHATFLSSACTDIGVWTPT